MGKSSLKEIAEMAGVAKSTVSRALRNHASIPEATRQRVREIAAKLGYRPDPLIAALVNKRWAGHSNDAGTIAWVMANPGRLERGNYFMQALLKGARKRTETLGYGLEEFSYQGEGMSEERLSQILFSRGIRGVCVAPLPPGRAHLDLQWEYFAGATIGYSLTRPSLHRAVPHQFQGGMEALRQLSLQGYRRIGVWITEAENSRVNYQWMAGALLFPKLNPGVECSILEGNPEGPSSELIKWIKEHRIEVVLASNPSIKALIRNAGLDIPSATLLWTKNVGMPGIDQKLEETAAAAIDLVVGQLRRNELGIPETPRFVMVESVWRE
ncbi:MAG TPA: LacI family DNA-binding transcriptional regulator [Roseimicrobium sp.]|nr:LacI family DNA-binding transcriptional regulator [Roseimicrobium sp.]